MSLLAGIKIMKNNRPWYGEHISNVECLSLARSGVAFQKEAEIFIWKALIHEIRDRELIIRIINNGGVIGYINKLERDYLERFGGPFA